MNLTALDVESLSLLIEQEIRVNAPVDVTFAALLEQLGPSNERPDGAAMPLKLEPWPGGRWFRDLGGNSGHLWAHVQSIKQPTLLELTGPLFMSYPVANTVQYRLNEEGAGTVIKFRHSAFGLVQDEHKKGVHAGWTYIHEQTRKRAESSR
jgi:hypothetical protein